MVFFKIQNGDGNPKTDGSLAAGPGAFQPTDHHCLVGWICVGWMVTRASNISRRSALFVRTYASSGPQQTFHANDRRFFPE
jgi:hypothetical protein